MRFAIRDDDLNYFWKADDIERVYGRILDRAPVSFSVVPFVKPHSMLAPPECYSSDDYAVGENTQLVSWLKDAMSRGRVGVTQHGVHHESMRHGYEFDRGKDLVRKLGEGKAHLEEALGVRIKMFVPPHNTILSSEGIRAVETHDLDLLISYGNLPRSLCWRRLSHWRNGWRLLMWRAKFGRG